MQTARHSRSKPSVLDLYKKSVLLKNSFRTKNQSQIVTNFKMCPRTVKLSISIFIKRVPTVDVEDKPTGKWARGKYEAKSDKDSIAGCVDIEYGGKHADD